MDSRPDATRETTSVHAPWTERGIAEAPDGVERGFNAKLRFPCVSLPAEQRRERERLLDELAQLVSLAGYSDFIFGPLLLPDDRSFPDEWRPTLAGARALLTRLMAYARLGSLTALLRHDQDTTWETDDGEDYVPPHRDAAAWFSGVNEFGTYLFGVRVTQLEDPTVLAGVLAHETAHAWRFRKDIMVDPPDEERLTDLTTVFLGFGVLTANIAHLANKALQQRGYLGAFPLCFALGVQLALRNNEAERKHVLNALGQDQRVMVNEVNALFSASRASLIERLRLPPEPEWVRPPKLTLPPPYRVAPGPTTGRDIVFRVSAPPVLAFAMASGIVGACTGAASLSWWPLLLPVIATPCAFLVKRDRCSGNACGATLRPDASTCPSCGGHIVGRIRRMSERDTAEAKFLAADDERAAQARAIAKGLLRL